MATRPNQASPTSTKTENHKIKLIYNPNAGKKRKFVTPTQGTSLEDIKGLFEQYQLMVDYYPTEGPGHATKLAQDSVKEGYKIVIAAGGDGTISEVATGLINTDINLGILPLGSFMNTARMLSIPIDLEKAVAIIKIGRTRKIDVAQIKEYGGEKLTTPHIFVESAGIGLDAEFHKHFVDFEGGDLKALWRILKLYFEFFGYPAKIKMDGEEITTKATLVNISNGPFTGAALPIAPDAKLNDHRLTVTLYKMTKWQLIKHFLWVRGETKNIKRSKIKTYQAKNVRIETKVKRLVHADGRDFGETPVEFEILPNALNVISGFPKKGEAPALIKRTYLDP